MISDKYNDLLDHSSGLLEWLQSLGYAVLILIAVFLVSAAIFAASKTFMDRFERGLGDLLSGIGQIGLMAGFIFLDAYVFIPAYDAGQVDISFIVFIMIQAVIPIYLIGRVLQLLNPKI